MEPLTGVSVNAVVADCPAGTVNEMGFAETVKSGAAATAFTVTLATEDWLPLKLASPKYCAEMLWVPTGNVLVVKVAAACAFSVPLPKVVTPSRKFTLPVGVPAADEVTVAVTLTACPCATVLGAASTAVVVVAPVETVPIPDNGTSSGLPTKLPATITLPSNVTGLLTEVGRKLTSTVQLAPEARLAPQLLA